MKKLFISGLVGLFCLALTVPAMAKLEFSGLFQTDVYYLDVSSERAIGGLAAGATTAVDGYSRTYIDLADTGNRLYWKYTSDDEKLISYWQFRPYQTNGTVGSALEFAWVQWELSPMFKFRVGKSEQTFAIMAPSQTIARNNTTVVGIGYGNIHGGTAREQVKAYIYPAPNIRIEFAAIDPGNPDSVNNGPAKTGTVPAGMVAGTGNVVSEDNTLPRLDLAVNFKIANFEIEPSVTWLQQAFDGVAAGSDDSYDCWGAALGIKTSFGPLQLSGEIAWGQNLGAGNYVGGTPTTGNRAAITNGAVNPNGGPFVYADAAGNSRFEDSDNLGWWIDAGFVFGPAALHVIYGELNIQNDGDPSVANDGYDQTSSMFVVNLPVKVSKGWTIKPEIAWYSADDSATISGVEYDGGDMLMVGVGFILAF